MDPKLANNCKAKVGMLTLRTCARPSTQACGACGIPLCDKHLCGGATGILCPDCAAKQADGQQPQNIGTTGNIPIPDQSIKRKMTPADRARTRREWYGMNTGYYHSPYFSYWDYHTFDNYYDDSSITGNQGDPGGFDDATDTDLSQDNPLES